MFVFLLWWTSWTLEVWEVFLDVTCFHSKTGQLLLSSLATELLTALEELDVLGECYGLSVLFPLV